MTPRAIPRPVTVVAVSVPVEVAWVAALSRFRVSEPPPVIVTGPTRPPRSPAGVVVSPRMTPAGFVAATAIPAVLPRLIVLASPVLITASDPPSARMSAVAEEPRTWRVVGVVSGLRSRMARSSLPQAWTTAEGASIVPRTVTVALPAVDGWPKSPRISAVPTVEIALPGWAVTSRAAESVTPGWSGPALTDPVASTVRSP